MGHWSASLLAPPRVRYGSRLCENSNDRASVYKLQSIFGRFPPLQARRSEKVRFRCDVFGQFPSFHTTWVTNGKTPSEHIFSKLPQVADIARSASSPLARPLVLQITAFWVRAILG